MCLLFHKNQQLNFALLNPGPPQHPYWSRCVSWDPGADRRENMWLFLGLRHLFFFLHFAELVMWLKGRKGNRVFDKLLVTMEIEEFWGQIATHSPEIQEWVTLHASILHIQGPYLRVPYRKRKNREGRQTDNLTTAIFQNNTNPTVEMLYIFPTWAVTWFLWLSGTYKVRVGEILFMLPLASSQESLCPLDQRK